MTTPTEQESTATETKDIGELSFSDYEKVRRGETLVEASAPVEKPEQKESEDSETSETEEEAKEESEDESDLDEGEEDAKDELKEKPRKKSGYQRRIDKLNARVADERQRREEMERRLAALERPGESKSEKVETKADSAKDAEPNPEDFENHKDYVIALANFQYDQRQKEDEAKKQQSKLQEEHNTLLKSHQERVKAFAEKQKDFQKVIDEAVEDGADLSPALESLVLNAQNGPELLYELVKNRAELDRMNKLPVTVAAFEFGMFAKSLAAKSSESKPEPKKITTAPKPIEPVGSGKGTVAKSIDDPNLSFSDYERIRREQLKRKGA